MIESNDDLVSQLKRIADALEILSRPGKDWTPDYAINIAEFRSFDWNFINARVVKSDTDGPTHVQWNGQVFTRRSPKNKFESAIWFSRAAGKDEDGEQTYARLITFREIKDADPLPEKAREMVKRPAQVAPAPAPATPKPQPAQLISIVDYLGMAAAKPITKEAAIWIAQHVGITDQAGDYSPAARLLDYFYEAKHAGMRLTEAAKLLEQHNGNPAVAETFLK